jgi:predicted transposase YdaD
MPRVRSDPHPSRRVKTDPAIYTYLSSGPEAFRILTGGLELSGPYRFRSVTFKALERRADGVCEPSGDAEPTYVVEFQAQPEEGAWYNLLTKVGLIGEASPAAEVRGILIFLHERDDPGRPAGISHAEGPFHAVYLNRFLPDLLAQEPDNPYVAVFAPLVIERDEELKRQAPRLWQTIQSAQIPEPIRLRLAEILEFWFFERFRYLNPEEVWTMLNQLTPLEETVAYKTIFGRGEAKGKADGKTEGETLGKANSLKRLLRRRFGPLPNWAAERIDVASSEQLDTWLDQVLDADRLDALIGQ